MEVPYPTGKDKFQRVSMMPCSYSDYESETKGELPIRWISTHAKLIKKFIPIKLIDYTNLYSFQNR